MIFSATPRPWSGRIATNTASAPVLIAATPPIARISSVQDRPSPATISGWLRIASTSRRMAWPRRSVPGLANRAIARASPSTVQAQFGAEQPSMPKPGLSSSVTSSKAALTARWTGWSGST